MRALVTGVAGFIGSCLADRLLGEGHTVRGVDCFTPYYDAADKKRNLAVACGHQQFELVRADLRTADLRSLLADVDVVFHHAAQPGVRLSWADSFRLYAEHNILATQRLLEAVKSSAGISRFVFASSSSVYGNAAAYPTRETQPTRPHSPYGVTKAAAEQLCSVYAGNWGVPTVSLRYFTVYGPRQRPDMAMHRLIEAARSGRPFPLYGSGDQMRDFTFVSDAVAATVRAATAAVPPGTVINIAGGDPVSVNDVIKRTAEAMDREIAVSYRLDQPGDVERTGGAIDVAGELLGWSPRVDLASGLAAQARWQLAPAPAAAR